MGDVGRLLAGNVLDQSAAGRDVEHLRAPTDREEWEIAIERGPGEGQFVPVARRIQFEGRVSRVVAVLDRVDIGTAREEDAVARVKRRGQRVRLGPQLTRTSAPACSRDAT